MLVIHCSREDVRVLVNLSRVRELRNAVDGIELDVECYCGQLVTVYTGRKRFADGPTGDPVGGKVRRRERPQDQAGRGSERGITSGMPEQRLADLLTNVYPMKGT